MALFSNSAEFQKLNSSEQHHFKSWKKIYMNNFKRSEEEAEDSAYKEILKMRMLTKAVGNFRY
jgi:hypothetical protein